MHPRTLIVGTVPYNRKSTSRAFDAYFHYWEKDNLAQIFSNAKKPCKGHCRSLFQITDHRMLKRWFDRRVDTGIVYEYDDLPDAWEDSDLEVSETAKKAYRLGSKHTPFTHLLRGVLWRKKFWKTEKLDAWLDAFQPECVFLSFSDDFFISEIALYVAKRYNIPIVSSIGDDYYFNLHFSLDPLYYVYKLRYRRLIRRVFAHQGSAIYIGDKIRDKYNEAFGLDGETVYLASEMERREFRPISTEAPVVSYFGNIRMGRNMSLNDIGHALGAIDPQYRLHVFSNEHVEEYYAVFKDNPYVVFHGSIPYAEVLKKTVESDIVVIVEGFRKQDIEWSRYSLSTKVADSLAAGSQILVYGSPECGAIEYMAQSGAAEVCFKKEELETGIRHLLGDADYQKANYDKAIELTQQRHNLDRSTAIFENIVRHVVNGGKKECLTVD